MHFSLKKSSPVEDFNILWQIKGYSTQSSELESFYVDPTKLNFAQVVEITCQITAKSNLQNVI